MDWKSAVGAQLAPRLATMAPALSSGFVLEALRRALAGVGPLPSAADAADAQRREQGGDAEKAVREIIENHITYAAAQGFVTNIGGLVTATVTVPANITGLALVHCRLVAGIAHLRGYDLDDPQVHNAILATILGDDKVDSLIKAKKLPAPPMALATAPAHDPDLGAIIAAEVAAELISRVAGKKLALAATRRVPVVGGVVGAGTDAFVTWQIGKYARRELLARPAGGAEISDPGSGDTP